MYVIRRSRLGPEAEHVAVTRHADQLPPPWPQILKCRHDSFACPPPDPADDGLVQLLNGQFSLGKRVTDGSNDLLSLHVRQPDAVGKWRLCRDGRQRGCPYREIIGSQQMHGATGTIGLDQLVLVPQRVPHICAGGFLDTQCDRQLGR